MARFNFIYLLFLLINLKNLSNKLYLIILSVIFLKTHLSYPYPNLALYVYLEAGKMAQEKNQNFSHDKAKLSYVALI